MQQLEEGKPYQLSNAGSTVGSWNYGIVLVKESEAME